MNPRTALGYLSSLALTAVLLLALGLLVIYGTFYQAGHGIYAAQQHLFNAWFVLAFGFIPLPGVKLAVALLFVNLLAAGATRMRRSAKNAGLLLVHAGIALLFIDAAFGFALRQESSLTLAEGEESSAALAQLPGKADGLTVNLPVAIRLDDFTIKQDIASAAAVDYVSRVHVTGPNEDRDAVISMNRPLRIRDYTFYQSSYRTGSGVEYSTFAVIKNPTRMVPYFVSIMIALGLIIHFLIKLAVSHRRRCV